MTTLRERIEEVRVGLELFPRCLKCFQPIDVNEPLRNVVPVEGRERRWIHHACPRPATEAN